MLWFRLLFREDTSIECSRMMEEIAAVVGWITSVASSLSQPNSRSMRGLGSDGASDSADHEPLGCAADAAPDVPAARQAQRVVSFVREGGGLSFLVGQVALGRSEFRLTCFALQRKIVERLEVLGRDYCSGQLAIRRGRGRRVKVRSSGGLGGRRVGRRCGLESDGRGQRDLAGELAHDLSWGDNRSLQIGDGGQGLRKLRVAFVLASVRVGESLLRGSEFAGQLSAVAAVGASGHNYSDGQEH